MLLIYQNVNLSDEFKIYQRVVLGLNNRPLKRG